MTVTIEEAKVDLARILEQAEAGEEVLIGREPNHPIVKVVLLVAKPSRLTRHPDLIHSTRTHDSVALVNPLPPEEWGQLANG